MLGPVVGNVIDSAIAPVIGGAVPVTTDFIFTWRTTAPSESVTNPLRSGYNYNFTIDWGDGQQDTITTWDQAENTHEYAEAGDYECHISGVCETWSFITITLNRENLLNIKNLGVVGWKSFRFSPCANLESVVAGNTDTSNLEFDVTPNLFKSNTKLVTFDLAGMSFETQTTLLSMFNGCTLLETAVLPDMLVGTSTKSLYLMGPNCPALTSINTFLVKPTSLKQAFQDSTLIDADISQIDPSELVDGISLMLRTAFSTVNYDKCLAAWKLFPLQPNVSIGFGTAKYSNAADRAYFTDAPNNWVITDGGPA